MYLPYLIYLIDFHAPYIHNNIFDIFNEYLSGGGRRSATASPSARRGPAALLILHILNISREFYSTYLNIENLHILNM